MLPAASDAVAGTVVVVAFLAWSGRTMPGVVLVLPAAWVLLVACCRGYESRLVTRGPEGLRRVARAGVALIVAGALASYAFTLPLEPDLLLGVVVATTAASLSQRLVADRVQRRRSRRADTAAFRIVVVGHRREVMGAVHELRRTSGHGCEVVAACLVHPSGSLGLDVPVTPDFGHVAEVVADHAADCVVVLPCHHLDPLTMRRLGWEIERSGAHLCVGTGLTDVSSSRSTETRLGDLAVRHVRAPELHGPRRLAKEIWERSGALVALVVLAPLLAAVALAVRLDSPGPAVFRQQRIGRNDVPFTMLKFRTMTADAELRRSEVAGQNEADGLLFKVRQDPRVTRLGRLLRRSSLDELPQLVNVLLGQMSLVGPRPPLPAEVAAYDGEVARRLVVKPGITGLWQVSGRSDLSWEESVRLDLSYVENWSLSLDALILLRTVRAVISHRGAY